MNKQMKYDERDLPSINELANAIQSMMGNVALREDVSIFTARQLEYVKTQVYEAKFPDLKSLRIVPITTDTPPSAETVAYKIYDRYGMAKIIANYADDLPRADVAATEKKASVKSIGVAYGYSVLELAASNQTGANLPMHKALSARRAVEIELSRVALYGDDKHDLYGLLTHPNIGETVLPSGKDWLTGNPTAQDLIDDVRAIYDAVRLQSNGAHTPNMLLLPMRHLALLQRTIMPNTMGKSVLTWLREEFPNLKFEEMLELQGKTGEKSHIVCGEFDRLNLSQEIPLMFDQLPAEARGLELLVNCHARTAGTLVYMPLAFTKAEC